VRPSHGEVVGSRIATSSFSGFSSISSLEKRTGASMSARPCIFMVEDSEDDILLITRAISRIDETIAVVVARDGEEALDFCSETNAADVSPFLMLLDLKLPKLGGEEVFAAFRTAAKTDRLPIIMMSSSTEHLDALAARGIGADGYLRKPLSSRKLAEYVQLYKPLS
jgi:DNA-binding response OmpR family regulator